MTPFDSLAPARGGPALSMVVTGRNDGYGGDFNGRFLRTLAFNHARLAERDVVHEIVLVEWAPPADRRRLCDVVREALPNLGSVLTTYLVDPRYHEACTLNPRLAYLEYLAKNVGIRRARGRAILATNTDIYLGRGVVQSMAEGIIDPRTVYRATRTDVKLGADESHVHWDLLEDARNHSTYKTIQPPLYAGGSGDFILLERESLHALRGFNEVYRLARVGIDVNFLVKAYSSGYRIVDIGAPVYHTAHAGSFRTTKNIASSETAEAAWGVRGWPSREVIYENPDTWGLRDAPERRIDAQTTWLDFSWDAVPPLVDLRRIVLPAARVGQPAPAADGV
jgi:hypothetical protein